MNAVQLSIFASKTAAVCDEMGAVLQRSAFSPNIRDRLDYSCALFNPAGELCAQAAHIPVHLGSMAYAMQHLVAGFAWRAGDTVVVNDPYLGGTHLPDVTLISPVFVGDGLTAFVANRAHHADIGGDSPGSMPLSRTLAEEGILLSPRLLARNGELEKDCWEQILDQLHVDSDTQGDFLAQMAANQKGIARLAGLASATGIELFDQGLEELNQYAEQLARSCYEKIPDGIYRAQDFMDDDGQGHRHIAICVSLKVQGSDIELDFAGTHNQVPGNINCPISVAAAAVYYVFRCLLPEYTPACAGAFRAIGIKAPEGCLINARRPAAVAAGNVETSSRLVDLLISALRQAIPERMPADAQGTMNNIAMGSHTAMDSTPVGRPWSYYETIGGGMGAHATAEGLSGVQSHMTNTLNTPVEVLETAFPVRVRKYALRENSGGRGKYSGGEGLIREYEFLENTRVTLLTERRSIQPSGSEGGEPAKTGANFLNGKALPAKVEIDLSRSDRLSIQTPGGGGYGHPWGTPSGQAHS